MKKKHQKKLAASPRKMLRGFPRKTLRELMDQAPTVECPHCHRWRREGEVCYCAQQCKRCLLIRRDHLPAHVFVSDETIWVCPTAVFGE